LFHPLGCPHWDFYEVFRSPSRQIPGQSLRYVTPASLQVLAKCLFCSLMIWRFDCVLSGSIEAGLQPPTLPTCTGISSKFLPPPPLPPILAPSALSTQQSGCHISTQSFIV
jgi:hypothetical protein